VSGQVHRERTAARNGREETGGKAAGRPGPVTGRQQGRRAAQRLPKALIQVAGIGIVQPAHQVNRVGVGPKIVLRPQKGGDGVRHLPIREAEAESASLVDAIEVVTGRRFRLGAFRRNGQRSLRLRICGRFLRRNAIGGGRGQEQQGANRLGQLGADPGQFVSQVAGVVAGGTADDGEGRRLAMQQGLDPGTRVPVAGQLVPAKDQAFAARQRQGNLGNGRRLRREGTGADLGGKAGVLPLQVFRGAAHGGHEALPGTGIGGRVQPGHLVLVVAHGARLRPGQGRARLKDQGHNTHDRRDQHDDHQRTDEPFHGKRGVRSPRGFVSWWTA
jgi:hypothetical protein